MKLIYLFLFLLIFFIMFLLFQNSNRKIVKAAGVALFVVIVIHSINSFFILPSDTLTITALGEQNENAGGYSIVFSGIISGGKKQNYVVSSGNWLDTDEELKWGAFAPTNLTDSIVIRIPRSSNRSVQFFSNKWTGKVSVSLNGGKPEIFDTYSEADKYQNFPVVASNAFLNIGLLGLVIIIIETIIISIIVVTLFKFSNRFIDIIKKHPDESIYIGLSIIGFIIMVSFADKRSTWVDDTAAMGIGNKYRTLFGVIKANMIEDPPSPPLFSIVWHYWAKLIPVGGKQSVLWAKFVGILSNTIAFYAIAKVVKKGWNRYIAVLAEAILISSHILITASAYAVRMYAIIILIVVFYINVMIEREKEKKISLKSTLLLTVAILLICYTHFFGMLFSFGFFCYEVLKFKNKKISYKFIFPYILSAVLYLPWLVPDYLSIKSLYGENFWPEIPTLKSICVMILTICDSQMIIVGFFIVGVFLTLLLFYKNNKGESELNDEYLSDKISLNLNMALIYEIIATMGIAYIYSRYLKPEASVWFYRYFLQLIPLIAILSGFAVYVLFEKILEENIQRGKLIFGIIVFLYLVNTNVAGKLEVSESIVSQPYREAADFLLNQMDASYNDTLIIASSYYSNGWDYYTTHNGKFSGIHYVQGIDDVDLNKYKVVYLFDVHIPLGEDKKEELNNKFNLTYQDAKSGVYKYVKK